MNNRRTASAITSASTAAIVTLTSPRFENETGEPDPEFITMEMQITFNGAVGELGDRVTFARNASQLQKNAAIRARVNDLTAQFEPGAGTLNNANIQIVGLPV